MINKKESINYWNTIAKDWKNVAYNTDNKNCAIFPTSQVRQEIVVREIKKLDKNIRILDIGCADGSLVIELVKNGYMNIKGFDNSPKMIEEAKKQLKKQGYNLKNVFTVKDADDLYTEERFDVIIAMGLIEYVTDLDDFLSFVYDLLNEDGIAFIESRNKLFNLFSANEYTIETTDKKELIEELNEIAYLSPNRLEDVAPNVYINIGEKLKNEDKVNKEKIKYEKYPFNLPQYSPLELKSYLECCFLMPVSIIYYHCHPFPPRFKNSFPELYDKLGIMMQPLGYTPVGALICSAFIMVVKK